MSRFELEQALRGVPIPLTTRGVALALISRMDLDGTTRAFPKVGMAQQIAADIFGPVAAGLDKDAAEKEAKRRQRLVSRHLTVVRRLGFLRRDGRSHEGLVAPWVACIPLDDSPEDVSTGHSEGASTGHPLDSSGCQPEAPIPRVGTTGRHEWVPPHGTPSLPSLPLDRVDRRARERAASGRTIGELVEDARGTVARKLGYDDTLARSVVDKLAVENPGLDNIAAFVNSPGGLAKARAAGDELARAAGAADLRTEVERRRAAAALRDRCEDGELNFIHPGTGLPNCVLCRRRANAAAAQAASARQESARRGRRSTA